MQQVIANHGTMALPMTESESFALHKRVGLNARISLVEANHQTNTFIFEATGSKSGPHRFQLPNFQWLDGEEVEVIEADDSHFERWMSKRMTQAGVPRELALTTCLIFNNERAISILTELKNFHNTASLKQRDNLLRGTNAQRIELIKKIIGAKMTYTLKLDKLNSNRVKTIAFYLCGKTA